MAGSNGTPTTCARPATVADAATSIEVSVRSDPRPNGAGDQGVNIVPTQPAPFSLVVRQQRWGNAKLYAVITVFSAFGRFDLWFEGRALADTLAALARIADATKAGIDLPPEVQGA